MGVQKHPGTHSVSGTPFVVPASDPIEITSILAGPAVGLAPDGWRAASFAAVHPHALALAAPAFTDRVSMGYVLGNLLSPTASDGSFTAGATGPRLTDGNSDIAMHGDIARSLYGVTGAGIKIGILSDSFDLHGGMAADIAVGNLPWGVQILEEGTSGHDEGRAMADLIHKVAPGAQILFHTATNGEADFASGIAALQAAGCNVIVDDVAYLDEPFFQDGGLVQQAVENAVAAGVSYFTSASNEGTNYVEQDFAPMQLAVRGLPGGVVVQNFGAVTNPQPWVDVTVGRGGQLMLDLQWDQPFASIGAGAGSSNSIGMALYDSAGQLVAATRTNVAGGNPVQVLTYVNTEAGSDFRLVLFANGGSSLPGTFKIINYGNGTINQAAGTGSGTVIGHEMVATANTVGAIAWSATPAFGGSGAVERFSSVGTGTILLDRNGNAVTTPISTGKVNFVAPDGSMTSVFAPFYGTSAAAPDAAAVAALMLQANPWLTPAQLSSALEHSAAPVAGFDIAGGAGLVQADVAVQLALGLAASHTSLF